MAVSAAVALPRSRPPPRAGAAPARRRAGAARARRRRRCRRASALAIAGASGFAALGARGAVDAHVRAGAAQLRLLVRRHPGRLPARARPRRGARHRLARVGRRPPPPPLAAPCSPPPALAVALSPFAFDPSPAACLFAAAGGLVRATCAPPSVRGGGDARRPASSSAASSRTLCISRRAARRQRRRDHRRARRGQHRRRHRRLAGRAASSCCRRSACGAASRAVALLTSPPPPSPPRRRGADPGVLARRRALLLLDPPRSGRLPHSAPRRARSCASLRETANGIGRRHRARRRPRRMKLDNYYALGGTGALTYERHQADLPHAAAPAAAEVFLLGLGTGITAGAALEHPIEHLTAAELVPDVVTAARDALRALRQRPVQRSARAQSSSAMDATVLRALRTPLRCHRRRPVHSLAPRRRQPLYARALREPCGRASPRTALFAQWLPLYQLSRREFVVIARTMLAVFPQVTLWRGDFLPDRPIVALVGQAEPRPLEPEQLVQNFRRRQGGRRGARASILALTGISTPATWAPTAICSPTSRSTPTTGRSSSTRRRSRSGSSAAAPTQWFTGAALGAFFDALAARLPVQRDPYLARLSAPRTRLRRAGARPVRRPRRARRRT